MHADIESPTGCNSGNDAPHASVACVQRGRNAQPDGGCSMFGGNPLIGTKRSTPVCGNEAKRPRVYG
jgi:hypothetical protein